MKPSDKIGKHCERKAKAAKPKKEKKEKKEKKSFFDSKEE